MKVVKFMGAGVLLLSASAIAQVGTLDQVSPYPPPPNGAVFTLQSLWQAQIRPGLSGQLEGIRVTLNYGAKGAEFAMRIRLEAAPASIEPAFDGVITKTMDGEEVLFVDMTGAGVMIAAGEPFVMEVLQTTASLVQIGGSHVSPPAAPLYPEPLYCNGVLYSSGWKIGFDTFVLEPPPCYCDCDGDAKLSLADFGCFQTLFAFGDPYADCNGDKVLNLADFGCFQTRFALGCP